MLFIIMKQIWVFTPNIYHMLGQTEVAGVTFAQFEYVRVATYCTASTRHNDGGIAIQEISLLILISSYQMKSLQ